MMKKRINKKMWKVFYETAKKTWLDVDGLEMKKLNLGKKMAVCYENLKMMKKDASKSKLEVLIEKENGERLPF